jgi:hypothetical protein
MGDCRINRIASSIAPKVLKKSTVGISREAFAKLRGSLIASSSSAVLFRELGVREFKGRTISRWLREIPSYEKGSGESQPSLTIASRDFAKGECQSPIFQLARSRVARGASTRAHRSAEKIRAVRSRGTPGTRLSFPPSRPSRFQRAKNSSIMSRYAKKREHSGPGAHHSTG